MSVPMRVCVNCGKEKVLTEFHKNKYSRQGRHPTCKVCQHERQRKYLERDPAGQNNELLKKWGVPDGIRSVEDSKPV